VTRILHTEFTKKTFVQKLQVVFTTWKFDLLEPYPR